MARVIYESDADLSHLSRRKVAEFIGARETAEVLFTRNTTEAINLLAYTWGRQNVGPGDEIVLTEMEHHSNLIPWILLKEQTGATLKHIPFTDDGLLDMEAARKLITPRTKLVSVVHASNVLGTMRMTRALLPALERSGQGHIVNVGSVAGFEVYEGGAGYTGAKHAERALTRTLRLELLGKPIRVTDISPGLVETEFSLVRFQGDAEKAAAVYRGMTPLRGEDVADCIAWAVTRPPHVNVDEIVVRPLDQATATLVHRRNE